MSNLTPSIEGPTEVSESAQFETKAIQTVVPKGFLMIIMAWVGACPVPKYGSKLYLRSWCSSTLKRDTIWHRVKHEIYFNVKKYKKIQKLRTLKIAKK